MSLDTAVALDQCRAIKRVAQHKACSRKLKACPDVSRLHAATIASLGDRAQ